MNIDPAKDFKKTDSLRSGRYYRVKTLHRCYRINEPDHFLKDIQTSFFGYFDKQDQFRHFNRLETLIAAKTTVSDIFSIQDLKSLEIFELLKKVQEKLQISIPIKKQKTEYYLNSAIIKKTVDAFAHHSKADTGVVHSLEELKRKYLNEYLAPPDLAH